MVTDLITRLSKLDAPDREVDALIVAELEPHIFDAPGFAPVRPIPSFHIDPQGDAIRFDGGGIMCLSYFPRLTASVDAAIALAERVLPFTHLVSTYHDDMACSVKIHCCPEGLSGEWKFDVKGDHERLAIAYCIAILRAIALLRTKEVSSNAE